MIGRRSIPVTVLTSMRWTCPSFAVVLLLFLTYGVTQSSYNFRISGGSVWLCQYGVISSVKSSRGIGYKE